MQLRDDGGSFGGKNIERWWIPTIGWYFILIVCCGFEGGILVQEVSDD